MSAYCRLGLVRQHDPRDVYCGDWRIFQPVGQSWLYDSLAVNVIVVVFMLLSSLNFTVLYLVLIRRTMRLRDNAEIRIYFRHAPGGYGMISL